MKHKLTLLLLTICLFNPLVFAKNLVLHYKPKVVTLTGIVKIKTFPGAPNYERIEAGDDIESGPYLILDHPIDVVASINDAPDTNSITEKNLQILQIISGDSDNWNNKYIGKHVRITGTLLHATWGHHHTKILIEANRFGIAK